MRSTFTKNAPGEGLFTALTHHKECQNARTTLQSTNTSGNWLAGYITSKDLSAFPIAYLSVYLVRNIVVVGSISRQHQID